MMKINEIDPEYQLHAYIMLKLRSRGSCFESAEQMMEWDRVRLSIHPNAKQTEINKEDWLRYLELNDIYGMTNEI